MAQQKSSATGKVSAGPITLLLLQYAIKEKNEGAIDFFLARDVKFVTKDKDGLTIYENENEFPLQLFYNVKPTSSEKSLYAGFEGLKSELIGSELPHLQKTEKIEAQNIEKLSKESIKNKSDQGLIKLIKCHCITPLEVAFRQKLIEHDMTLSNGMHISEYIAEKGTEEVTMYYVKINPDFLFKSKEYRRSMIDASITNTNHNVLKKLVQLLPHIKEQSLSVKNNEPTQDQLISDCLCRSLKRCIESDILEVLHILLNHNLDDCGQVRFNYLYGEEQNTLLHIVSLTERNKTFLEVILEKVSSIDDNLTLIHGIRFIDWKNSDDDSVLHQIVRREQSYLLGSLLSFNPEILLVDGDGNTALQIAVEKGNEFLVSMLVSNIKDPKILADFFEAKNKQGLNALHLAINQRSRDIANALLQAKANFYAKDGENGYTILHHASKLDSQEAREDMISFVFDYERDNSLKGRIAEVADLKGNYPMHLAIELHYTDVVSILLEKYPDEQLYVRNPDGYTPLHYATLFDAEKTIDIINLLFNTEEKCGFPNKKILNQRCKKGRTPLHLAISKGSQIEINKHSETVAIEILNLIFERGDEVDPEHDYLLCRDNDLCSILHHAVMTNYSEILKFVVSKLIEDPPENHSFNRFGQQLLNLQNLAGRTALIMAIVKENFPIFTELLNYNPSLHCRDDVNQWTVLHHAIDKYSRNTAFFKWLKDKTEFQSLINTLDKNYQTALHLAIRNENEQLVELLIANGAVLAVEKEFGSDVYTVGLSVNEILNAKFGWKKSKTVAHIKDYVIIYKVDSKYLVSTLPNFEETELIDFKKYSDNVLLCYPNSGNLETLVINVVATKCPELIEKILKEKTITKEFAPETKLIYVAAQNGSKAVVRYVCEEVEPDFDYESQDTNNENTLIHYAAKNTIANIKTLKYLLRKTEEFEKCKKDKLASNKSNSPLQILLTNASKDQSSFDCSIVCKRNIDGNTAVHLSIENKNFCALETLLSLSNACLEISDKDQNTLLHYAVKVSGEKCDYLNTVLNAFKTRYPEDFQSRLYPCNSDGFPPLQYAIELKKLPAALILIGDSNSVQLPYQDRENNVLLCSPKSQLPLRILYKTPKSSKDPPSEYWIGFRIKMSSKIINWIATSLPVISPKKCTTLHFDRSSMIEIEPNMWNTNILKVILQSHQSDPFKSAVSSKLITQNLKFRDGHTLLKYVGRYSTREVIAFYIDWYKCVIYECTKGQSSLIEYTVINSDLSVLRFLLEKLPESFNQSLSPLRPDATQEVIEQYKIALCLKNALRLSLNNDNVQALELLLGFNARHDHTYDGQNTLLHLMVTQRKPCEFIISLLTRNMNVEKLRVDSGTVRFIDAQNAQNETALHLALQSKQENTTKAILSFAPEIITKDSKGNTPLHSAILLNNYDIIVAVLNLSQHDPEVVNSVNRHKCTPLHLSVDNGDYSVTELLLTSKADIYCRDYEEKTIFHHAIEIVDSERRSLMFNGLIKFEDETSKKAHKLCTIQDNRGNTPLNLAITKSDNDIVTSLLEYPSVLEVANKLGQTPLHLAVMERDEKTMESILNVIRKTKNMLEGNIPKMDNFINSQDSSGCTPLHLSIQRKNTDALTKLLAVNPYLDIFNNDGDQPLHLAVLSEKNEIFDCVLDSILKLEVGCIGSLEQSLTCTKQRNGKTPLHLSIENRNTHALQSLLQNKPCLDVCDTNGDTVLHCAVKNSSDDSTCLEIVLKELEERFSDDYSYFTYMLNSQKLTPLHYAIKSSNLNCIKMLLEHQVNLAFLDPCGDKTLLNGIDGFLLSFVKYNGEYWIGYKFTKARKPYWILTNLPNLNHTEIVERDLPTTKISDFKLLKLISQSQSTEPLDAALRNKLLTVNTSLNHEHMSQVIARHGTKQSLRCLLSKTKSGLFHRSDGKLSMIECTVSNPNIDALEYLLHSLPTFQQQQQQPGGIALSVESTQMCSCLENSLQLSVSNESSEALISLLRFYPKIDCTYIDDNTLIHHMVICNKSSKFIKEVIEVIREIETSNSLYKDKQIINHSNFEKKTALHCCIERKQLSTLEVILQFNPEAFVMDENDETPLHYAVNSNELEFVQAIYQHAPCIELLSAKNIVANTALHLAVKNANDGIVRYLLECEPPFDSQNSHGFTVLHLAVVIENPTQRETIMHQLILHNTNKGLNVTCIQDSELKSPLHLAVSKQYPDAVDSLLAADPRALHIRDNKEQTPLHLAIIPSLPCSTTNSDSSGEKVWMEPALDDKIFDGILEAIDRQGKHDGTQSCNGIHLLCMQDERKRTALHYAIEYHYSYAFTELLKTGSCLDISDDIGNTLAFEAVKKNSDVKFLKELVAELERRCPES